MFSCPVRPWGSIARADPGDPTQLPSTPWPVNQLYYSRGEIICLGECQTSLSAPFSLLLDLSEAKGQHWLHHPLTVVIVPRRPDSINHSLLLAGFINRRIHAPAARADSFYLDECAFNYFFIAQFITFKVFWVLKNSTVSLFNTLVKYQTSPSYFFISNNYFIYTYF